MVYCQRNDFWGDTAVLYLVLAIISSAMIAIVMRISSDKVKANISMLAVNYLTCLLLAAVYTNFKIAPSDTSSLPITLTMGAFNGLLYLLGFVLLQYNTQKNGVVLSSVFMKLGLLVPIALSVFLFKEVPTILQAIGFVLALGAIILINYKKGTKFSASNLPLILMLLSSGSGDAMSKVFEVYGQAKNADLFLLYTFISAFLLCTLLVIYRKECPDKYALLYGVLVGVPNFFSAKFLLMSLSHMNAVIAYPTFSVGTILSVTLIGIIFFKERLRKSQWIALIIILSALVMLNI